MKVLVCGSRDYGNGQKMFQILDAVHSVEPISLIIHGDAKGADRLAGSWAKDRNIPCDAYPANWRPNGVLDRGAGIKRNAEMIALKPDLVIAFPLTGNGTWDTINRAKEAGIKLFVIEGNNLTPFNTSSQ